MVAVMKRDWTNLLWSEMTWPERLQAAISFSVACIVGLAMFLGALLVVGETLDGITRYNSAHDRCLKKATNGYEIKQCH